MVNNIFTTSSYLSKKLRSLKYTNSQTFQKISKVWELVQVEDNYFYLF